MKKVLLAAGILGAFVAATSLLYSIFEGASKVVLISLDTTRADHLGCYGYGRKTSPNIDKLAASGIRFTNCYASMPTTDPSHVSILTSAYPRTHGVLENGMEISNPNLVSLAQVFKKKGYATAAITAREILSPDSLKLEGFDFVSVPGHRRLRRRAEDNCNIAIEFLEEHRKDDVFLWVHFYDPHAPYLPPSPYDSKFNKGNHVRKDKAEISRMLRGFLPEAANIPNDEVAYYVSLYDGAICYMDYHIGRLLEYLETSSSSFGRSTPPFVIVVADHGETLGELREKFGYAFDHGEFLYDNDIKIPLIMSWGDRLPEGKTIDSLVESIDIAPTIVELMFHENIAEFSGKSFQDLLLDKTSEHKRYAFVHRRAFLSPHIPDLGYDGYAIVSQKYKLIENKVTGPELYNIAADKFERENLNPKKADIVEELGKELEAWKEEYPSVVSTVQIDEDKAEVLKALGYLP